MEFNLAACCGLELGGRSSSKAMTASPRQISNRIVMREYS